jgi:hypothetical protein
VPAANHHACLVVGTSRFSPWGSHSTRRRTWRRRRCALSTAAWVRMWWCDARSDRLTGAWDGGAETAMRVIVQVPGGPPQRSPRPAPPAATNPPGSTGTDQRGHAGRPPARLPPLLQGTTGRHTPWCARACATDAVNGGARGPGGPAQLFTEFVHHHHDNEEEVIFPDAVEKDKKTVRRPRAPFLRVCACA